MNFRRRVFAFLFHSSARLTTQYEAARLERVKEDAHWYRYDEPAYLRKERALNGERPLPTLLMRQAS